MCFGCNPYCPSCVYYYHEQHGPTLRQICPDCWSETDLKSEYDPFAHRLIFNPLAYGAMGDGITDDYTALQSAINAASCNPGGGAVYGMGATYATSRTLVIPEDGNVSLVGMHLRYTGSDKSKPLILVPAPNLPCATPVNPIVPTVATSVSLPVVTMTSSREVSGYG